VNAACGKEGALGQQGFVAGKGTSEGVAAFVNSSGQVKDSMYLYFFMHMGMKPTEC